MNTDFLTDILYEQTVSSNLGSLKMHVNMWSINSFGTNEPEHKKTNKMTCAQRRLWPARASTHSDQSLHCALYGWLRSQTFFRQTAKTLIRLAGCPGGSEASLGVQVILLVLVCSGSNKLLSDNWLSINFPSKDVIKNETPHDKTNKMTVCPV